MTPQQIKTAVDAGHTVLCDNGNYQVLHGKAGYYIICLTNGYCTGLHGQEGTQYEHELNGRTFWIEGVAV